jgi:excisionase family DNA binding protein
MNLDLKNYHYPFLWCTLAKLLNTKELAEYLKLTKVTIYKYAKEGKIPACRVGSRWRFDKNQIDELLKKGEEGNQ